jgi:hypothetical protein
MKSAVFASFAAAALVAGMASSAPAHAEFKEIEQSVPFVSKGSIRNWQAVDRDTLYVEDIHGRWYRAELMTNCFDLPFTETIGFDAGGTDRFDKFSAIVVRGQRCQLKNFVASGSRSASPHKRLKRRTGGLRGQV